MDEAKPLNLHKKGFLKAAQGTAGTEHQRCCKSHVVRQRGNAGGSLSIRDTCSAVTSEHQSWMGSTGSGLLLPTVGEEALGSFVKDQVKKYSKEEGSAAFHKLWEKKILLSL